MNMFRAFAQPAVLVAVALLATTANVCAQYAGYKTLTIGDDKPMVVALFYPTAVTDRAVPMGPWLPIVAPGAPPSDIKLKGLILLSHGTGGTELNHHNLGTRLAREGYLVAALRHPGDNWQDRSLIASGKYLSERPRQLSRVLDALLASLEWGPRVPTNRIGAVGHSAGGYSVLALAGAQADAQRSAEHCSTVRNDQGYCSLAKVHTVTDASTWKEASASEAARLVSVSDSRVGAVVALAPMAVVFTPESLAAISVPMRIIVAGQDTVLNGQYHGGYVANNLSEAQTSTVPAAGHFAFMAQPTFSLPSAAGDASVNPPGFDRVAFLRTLEDQVVDFFAQQWH
ncbi:Predicted dienelactone hydrolase [Cupriavidus sp. YR651]|uniref:alpha/beta hydrolase family protein n=1 Tax=Cupriavidus sp. YR651 TaxID=1855315 RepID=UPI0008826628|nr:hypothetical protein [Cupriavidus sp. YR651]SDD81643.1 Predicted dienelactone hydrolase [Cupriavidus sp. YR651]